MKSIRQILAFFGIGLLLLAGLNWLARLPGGDTRERQMRERLAAIPGKEAVSLGASIAAGFDLSPLCVRGTDYHLAQDAFEMSAVVDYALSRPNPPRLWVALIAPTIQSMDNGSPGAGWPGQREATYRALYAHGYRRLIGGDWRQAITANYMPALGDEAWRPHMRWLFERFGYRWQRGVTPEEMGRTRLGQRDEEALAKAATANRVTLLRRIAYYTPDVPERATAALLDAGAAIRRSGGRLVVVVPPMTRSERTAAFRDMPEQIRGFRVMLGRLARSGVLVRDYWADPRFEGRLDLFRDPEHLNSEGAALFSHIAADDLRGPLGLPRRCTRPN